MSRPVLEEWAGRYQMGESPLLVVGRCFAGAGTEEGRGRGGVFEAYVGALDKVSRYGGGELGSSSDASESEGSSSDDTEVSTPATDLATPFIEALIAPTLQSTIQTFEPPDTTYDKTAVSRLNTFLTGQGLSMEDQRALWTLTEDNDAPLQQRFLSAFRVSSEINVYGQGQSIQEAKARAATRALERGAGAMGSDVVGGGVAERTRGLSVSARSRGSTAREEGFQFGFNVGVGSEFRGSSEMDASRAWSGMSSRSSRR